MKQPRHNLDRVNQPTPPQRRANQPKEEPAPSREGRWARFNSSLAAPVSGASLAAFRAAVGLVMSLEVYTLCRPYTAAVRTGATPLEAYYTGSAIKFNFPYAGFQWLPLFPASCIHVLVGLLALAGVTMALGFCYRASVVVVFLTWGYLFAVESTRTYWARKVTVRRRARFAMTTAARSIPEAK